MLKAVSYMEKATYTALDNKLYKPLNQSQPNIHRYDEI